MSNYDTSTAVTIASESGFAGTLLGALVPLVPAILPVIFIGLVVWRRIALSALAAVAMFLISPAYNESSLLQLPRDAWDYAVQTVELAGDCEWQAIWQSLHIAALSLAASPLAVSVAALGGLLVVVDPPRWLLARRPQRVDQHGVVRLERRQYLLAAFRHWTFRVVVAVAFAPIFMGLVHALEPVYHVPHDREVVFHLLRRPWVPTEEVTVESGETVTGYVLSTKDGWFAILQEHDRTIRYVSADDVAEREVCTLRTEPVKFDRLPLWHQRGAQLPNPYRNTCGNGLGGNNRRPALIE